MRDEWIEKLMKTYGKSLLKYLSVHTDTREDAEDLMQEVFLSCYKSRDRFDASRCSEQAWLFVLAKNRLKNYYRDKKSTVSLENQKGEEPINPVDCIERALHLMDCRDLTAEALEQLDERSRTVVMLRFFKEMNHEEIGLVMGLAPGNVRVIQSRALRRMEEYLDEKRVLLDLK